MNTLKRLKVALRDLETAPAREAAKREAQRKADLARWQAQHPVTSGLVPLVDYMPPRGSYHAHP